MCVDLYLFHAYCMSYLKSLVTNEDVFINRFFSTAISYIMPGMRTN